MAKVQEVIDLIEAYAPLETQAEWDNSGWQINLGKENFSKIMTALTVTQSVINQAKKHGCDLILAHHPLIFEPLKKITVGEITDAIQNGIQIYSAHTNVDLAKGGTTDTLCEKCGFGLCDKTEGFINYKKLDKKYNLENLKELVKKRLGLDCLKIINLEEKKTIKSVGFCAGSGGGEIPEANRLGIDLFITGEVKFHEAFEAKSTVVFEVGHFDSEKYIGEIFKRVLGDKYEIIEADEKRPYFYD
ncbi:MAG: Nif3-like dinuclear metal center hexameric protein [Candidatus Gastranaerophilales bacterium]|nr:Nif3-like dinuclear metal center hexameric protein [Candidatus Gastranaerophilales bacterium]